MRLNAGPHTIIVARGCIQVVEDVIFSEAHARLALHYPIRPPVVVPSDIESRRIRVTAGTIRSADEIGVAMTRGAR